MEKAHRSVNDAWVAYGDSVRRVRQLEAENRALRAELKKELRQPQNAVGELDTSIPHVPELQRPCAPVQSLQTAGKLEHYGDLAYQYYKLQLKCIALEAEHSRCHQQIEGANNKLRDAKKVLREWKRYSERKTKSKDRAFSPPAIPVEQSVEIDGKDRTPLAAPKTDIRIEPCGQEQQVIADQSVLRSSPRRQQPWSGSDCSKGRDVYPQFAASRVTSSQTTLDDLQRQEAPDSPFKADPSGDDEPVFVSARLLKRKRDAPATKEPNAQRIKLEASSPNGPIELKSEPSSDRSGLLSMRTLTSDLDATETAMITPRRPKRLDTLRERATSAEVARPTPQLNRTASSLSLGDLYTSKLSPVSIVKSEVGYAPLHRYGNDPCHNKSDKTAGYTSHHKTDILRPISANIQSMARRNNPPARAKPRCGRRGGLGKAADLSEDGYDGSSQVVEQTDGRTEVAHDVSVSRTFGDPLEEILNKPPSDELPDLRATRDSGYHGQRGRPANLVTPTSALRLASLRKTKPAGRSKSPAERTDTAQLPPGLEDPPPPVRPEDEPLRLRNVRTLKMSDFKVNPKYLGSEFAFADTLRGRDQRRNLHVCNKPDCCGGALQKVIAMGGSCLSGKSDAQALGEYVGPNWRDFMSVQTPDKQKQVTIQSHAHCFANQHGKHRQAFARRTTPPGLWRTDFPTTQEAADDRQKALDAERQAVDERFREALHGNGRWLFRDE